jgi:hypothetical protein
LARQRDAFRRIIEPDPADVIFQLALFLGCYDTNTAFPLLLQLFELGTAADEWCEIARILESYLLRRAVCGLTGKRYNQIFLALTRDLQKEAGRSASARIAAYLSALRGESGEWPEDAAFLHAWRTRPLYGALKPQARLVHILKRLNDACANIKHESIAIASPLTIEHIMPLAWREQWLLPDGSRGVALAQLTLVGPEDPRRRASEHRDRIIDTIGNLTIITQNLNSSVQNDAWPNKKPAILEYSLLPINQQLVKREKWDESAIVERAEELFQLALTIWPGPRGNGSAVGRTNTAYQTPIVTENAQSERQFRTYDDARLGQGEATRTVRETPASPNVLNYGAAASPGKVPVVAVGLRGAPGKPLTRPFRRAFPTEGAYRSWKKRKGPVIAVESLVDGNGNSLSP